VEKYGRVGQATHDNIIWHMCCACWITKARDTHSNRVIFIAFPGNSGYAYMPQGYIYTYIARVVTMSL
jgi:hypothetical protein